MSNTYITANTVTLPTIQATPSNYSITGSTITTGASWNGTYNTSYNTSFSSSNQKPILTIPNGEEKVILENGAALEVKGKVVINGLDLEERLKTIEQVLMIPERDATMESKYPSLKKKYEEYIKDLSKYRMWDTIKGDNK